jgi:hypothetical protein
VYIISFVFRLIFLFVHPKSFRKLERGKEEKTEAKKLKVLVNINMRVLYNISPPKNIFSVKMSDVVE